MYYNKKGEKIDLQTYADLFKDDYRFIKQDTLANGKWISTVWLGSDHSFGGDVPLIFETMVFPNKGSWGEIDMERYSTEEEAIKGHDALVKKLS